MEPSLNTPVQLPLLLFSNLRFFVVNWNMEPPSPAIMTMPLNYTIRKFYVVTLLPLMLTCANYNMCSSVALIGEPSEVYHYGAQRGVAIVFGILGTFVAAYVYLPVYFALRTPTIYEYLGKRFGKYARNIVAILCYTQTLLYMAVVLYTPAMALSAVSDLTTETSIVLMGVVCIIFSSLGGFRGILWTDVFQAVFMYAYLIIIIAFGIIEAGGVANVYHVAQSGKRLQIWDFSLDPSIRYTFWNTIANCIHLGVVNHTVNQVEVQRMLSIRDLKNSQSALLWSALPSFAIHAMATILGIVMYAVFSDCDPFSKASGAGLTKADQIVPYFMATRLSAHPGLCGLCISGIFSGAMTSVSSAVNSLAVVVIDDFLLPNINSTAAQKLRLDGLAKILVAAHGLLIIGLAFFMSAFQSVIQGVMVFNGMILGPTLGFYTLGMLTRGANEMGGILGIVSGVLLSGVIGLGSSLTGKKDEPLPLSTSGCSRSPDDISTSWPCCNGSVTSFMQETPQNKNEQHSFILFRVSFVWVSFIGLVTSLVVGYVSSHLIGSCIKQRTVDADMLSPVTKCWMKEYTDSNEIAIQEQIMKT